MLQSMWSQRVGHHWATEQQCKPVRIKQGDSIHRKRNGNHFTLITALVVSAQRGNSLI